MPLLTSLADGPTSKLKEPTPQPLNQHSAPSQRDEIILKGQTWPRPKAPQVSLPPVHTILFAADVYFRFCHNQPYSCFHEASLRQRIIAGELPTCLSWALLAASRRFSTLPDLQDSTSDDPLALVKLSWESMELPWNGAESDEEAVQVVQTIVLLVNIEHPGMFEPDSKAKLNKYVIQH